MLLNLWEEVGTIKTANCSWTPLIRAWCEKHGLLKDLNGATTVVAVQQAEEFNDKIIECLRQKFYRMKKRYEDKNINIL